MLSKPRIAILGAAALCLGAAWYIGQRDVSAPKPPAPAVAAPVKPPRPPEPKSPSGPVPTPPPAVAAAPSVEPGAPSPAPPAVRKAPAIQAAPPPAAPAPAPKPSIGADTPEERAAAAIDLDQVSLMLRDYRTRMGDNPVGTNAEIMRAVMGGNPKGATLGPPEGQALNERGELVDRWGTALFFHQMSATHTEIHSAGPDRTFGTDDDVIMK